MRSPRNMELIKAKIKELEKAHKQCTDSTVKKMIDFWIAAEKRKLISKNNSK
jgi:hypothetical protein